MFYEAMRQARRNEKRELHETILHVGWSFTTDGLWEIENVKHRRDTWALIQYKDVILPA